uniref:Retrovirus-related Pol polyprotein from transposon TNT 1-94 n=1 Tax=Tanacetum cinerariifolium TaxID=118510 RepID=A0A6L2LVK2_TANCI|nr:retrovirus-related Pol polyprotein from transposon TNT 1-94 [Tanacetum cinerariifolium]
MVIVDDYTRFGWVRFLRTKDETLKVFEKFLKNVQLALNTTVRTVRTDNRTEFVNKTLTDLFEKVSISHQTSVPRSPQQNGVVERRNRTLMEAARTMLIFAKAPLFLWAEAVATTCYTLNRSLIHTLYGKTYYELLKGKKPNLNYFRVFGALCYPTNDSSDIGKLKAKADIGLELKALQSGCTRSAIVKDTIIPSVPPTLPQLNELFQPFQRRIDDDEDFILAQQVSILVNDAPAVQDPVVIPVQHSSTNVSADMDTNADGFNTSFDHFDSVLFELYVAPEAVSEASSSNTIEPNEIPSTPLPHVQKWTKDHPLENVIGYAHAPVSTRKQLQTDAMWCFFNEFLTHVEPKNYKEALKHSC